MLKIINMFCYSCAVALAPVVLYFILFCRDMKMSAMDQKPSEQRASGTAALYL